MPIAAVLLVTSGRPLFYRGERVGRGGRVFEMLKFRTLSRNAEERLGPYLGEELVHRTREETTAIGGWLRATQLDEIPQLWNVVRGDMSLVGPRPIRPRFFASLVEELPAYWQRLVVRPGLTGFAQVRRGYETSMAEKLAHDLEWIADRSLRLYLRTLATTAWRVLRPVRARRRRRTLDLEPRVLEVELAVETALDFVVDDAAAAKIHDCRALGVEQLPSQTLVVE